MKVSILISGIKVTGNENAIMFPIIRNRFFLKTEYDINISIYTDHNKILKSQADIIIVSSWYIGRKLDLWKKDKCKLTLILKALKDNCNKLVWYDISDSTGTTQFEILDMVDSYWKCQVLENKDHYLKPTNTGRVFSDFYYKLWKLQDDIPQETHLVTPPSSVNLSKVKLAWNTGLSDYGLIAPLKNRLFRSLGLDYVPRDYARAYKPALEKRNNFISCRFGVSYKRESVAIGRKKLADKLKIYQKTDKLNRFQYFKEMANSNFVISPFGLGEITLRDFEAFLCGAVLIKPQMDHLETWPNFFSSDNIIQYQWDLENFDQIIEKCKDEVFDLRNKADVSQSLYLKYTSKKGSSELFCARFHKLLTFN